MGLPARVAQALQADVAAGRRVLGVAVDRDDPVALVERDEHAARAVAVARADGADRPQRGHGPRSVAEERGGRRGALWGQSPNESRAAIRALTPKRGH